jgi:hypothetical protein
MVEFQAIRDYTHECSVRLAVCAVTAEPAVAPFVDLSLPDPAATVIHDHSLEDDLALLLRRVRGGH